jgi:RNA polymerase sigma-32 factor
MSHELDILLVKEIQTGSRVARNRLVLKYSNFVHSIVRTKFKNSIRDMGEDFYEDAVQEGFIGLMRAAELFKLSKKVHFATYSVYWVWTYANRFFLQNKSLVRTGWHRRRADSHRDLTLDTEVVGEDGTTFKDMVEGVEPDIEEQLTKKQFQEDMQRRLERCRPERWTELMEDILHHRLMSDDPATFKDLGDKHGCSRENVRQVEMRLKKRLRQRLLSVSIEEKAS